MGLAPEDGQVFVLAANYAKAQEAAARERIDQWTYIDSPGCLRRARRRARVLLVDGWPSRGDATEMRRALDAVRAYTRRVEVKG